MKKERPLTIWTITHRPSDLPGIEFALRPHYVHAGYSEAGELAGTAATIEEIRALLPPGLFNLGRRVEDDPVIVESWV